MNIKLSFCWNYKEFTIWTQWKWKITDINCPWKYYVWDWLCFHYYYDKEEANTE